jgi:hypothetical protein
MLIYDPALDPYHCAVRLLAICQTVSAPIPTESVQILDFVLMFPTVLVEATLPKTMLALRKKAAARTNPFRQPPRSKAAVDSIRAIQATAASTLAVAKLIDAEELQVGMIRLTNDALPPQIGAAVNSYIAGDSEYRIEIIKSLSAIPPRGREGLKHRTKLLEYRYDAA